VEWNGRSNDPTAQGSYHTVCQEVTVSVEEHDECAERLVVVLGELAGEPFSASSSPPRSRGLPRRPRARRDGPSGGAAGRRPGSPRSPEPARSTPPCARRGRLLAIPTGLASGFQTRGATRHRAIASLSPATSSSWSSQAWHACYPLGSHPDDGPPRAEARRPETYQLPRGSLGQVYPVRPGMPADALEGGGRSICAGSQPNAGRPEHALRDPDSRRALTS
jgi:hypothetical protein